LSMIIPECSARQDRGRSRRIRSVAQSSHNADPTRRNSAYLSGSGASLRVNYIGVVKKNEMLKL